jgi:hypothetical chaperone protein
MAVRVGLDFGTSNSSVAIYDGGQVRLLPLDPGSPMPQVARTILYITSTHEISIGQEAVELYYQHNVNRQRRYERKWAGEIEVRGGDMFFVRDVYVDVDVLRPGRLLQYLKTALRKPGYTGTQIFDRYYRTGDLLRLYLRALKERAEAALGERIEAATIGRPVKFGAQAEADRQAQDTLHEAALAAGFEQVDFELEPVAAARDYARELTVPQNVVIFDFGGGTLDIAVMRLGAGQRQVFASGGVDIAGSDFDRAIIEKRLLRHFGLGRAGRRPEILELIQAVPDWISLPELSTPHTRRALEDAIRAGDAPVQMRRLQALIFDDLAFSFYNRVEAAKIELSTHGLAVIELRERHIDLWELYTRAQFEADIREFAGRIEQVLTDTLAASGLEAGQIDAVVKTGGSSNIPLFHDLLGRIFGADKVRASDAFTSVAAGLAVKAASGR